MMKRSEVVNLLLFEYDELSEEEITTLMSQLPRKIIRWLAINHPDNRMRKIFFQQTGVQIGEGTVINPNVIISDSYKQLVKIGERVAISPGVILIADSSPNNSRLSEISYVRTHLIVQKEIVIEDDAWIGAGAIILPGVKIGQGAIIGAGAVVTRDVAPYTIVAGVPAREIRKLTESE
jgi:acetyltransferase-like isoleucine patch superfamily enzyme